jgi:hypothetical protein
VDWIHLNQDRGKRQDHLHTVMNLQIPYNTGISVTSCGSRK